MRIFDYTKYRDDHRFDKLIQQIKAFDTKERYAIQPALETMLEVVDEQTLKGYWDILDLINHHYAEIYVRPSYLCQIHRDLYQYTDKQMVGQFKNVCQWIYNQDKALRTAPLSPYQTPQAMHDLCNQYDSSSLVVGCLFLYDFICIFPFNEGNYLMFTLLLRLFLLKSGYTNSIGINLEADFKSQQLTFEQVIFKTSKGWHENQVDATEFIQFVLERIVDAYQEN